MSGKKSGREVLADAAPLIEAGRAKIREKQIDAASAIAILERRTRETAFNLELPGGDVVRIRSRISRTEFDRCIDLFGEIAEARGAGDLALVVTRSNEIVGLLLAIDGMTPAEITAWLDANPQAISDLDAEEIVLAFTKMRKEELARQQQIREFRPE